jgi:hypothetical protein
MRDHDHDAAADSCNGRDVTDEVEIELVVERRIDRAAERDQEQRIAIWSRFHDRLGADIAAGSGPVVDDKLLAEPLRKPLSQEARVDVVRTAGGKTGDKAHRPRRIGLRPSYA